MVRRLQDAKTIGDELRAEAAQVAQHESDLVAARLERAGQRNQWQYVAVVLANLPVDQDAGHAPVNASSELEHAVLQAWRRAEVLRLRAEPRVGQRALRGGQAHVRQAPLHATVVSEVAADRLRIAAADMK